VGRPSQLTARWRRSRFADVVNGLIAAVLAIGFAIVALRLWRADLRAPLIYGGGDATQVLGYVQNVLETGWYLEGPRLGAPFGQHMHDFPLYSEMHFALLRLFTIATGDVALSVNLFYVLTYGLVALAMYWALRQLRVPGPVAVFGAVVYSLLPYHFTRSTGHIFLAAYYTVPVAGYVLVAAADGGGLVRGAEGGRANFRRLNAWFRPVVLGLLIGLGNIYYAMFTLVLLVPASVVGYVRRRSLKAMMPAAVTAGAMVGVIALASIPTFLYRSENGFNIDVPVRDARDTEIHALRPITLFLPYPDHRISTLGALSRRYASFPGGGRRDETLGIIGAIGLAGLLVLGVGAAAGWRPGARFGDRLRRLSALSMVALAFAVIGGGSTLIALTLSTQIRAWNRLSVFLGFFALVAVCLVLGVGWRAIKGRRRAAAAVALTGLLVLAVLDQTNDGFIPRYEPTANSFAADRAFVAAVEADFEPGAAIYQLPYVNYPEAGTPTETGDYDHLRGYLHSKQLRWSFGGMKGRQPGWQMYAGRSPEATTAAVAALAGFSGIWVDRRGYPDGGAALESELRALLGLEPMVSSDERFAVYDLRAYGAALRAELGEATWQQLADGLLNPVWPRWTDGVQRIRTDRDGNVFRIARPPSSLTLDNDGGAERDVVASLTLSNTGGSNTETEITWPDRVREQLTVGDEPLVVRHPLRLPPGESQVRLETPLASSQLRISDLWVADVSLVELLGYPDDQNSPSLEGQFDIVKADL